jgi:hypothetical protein
VQKRRMNRDAVRCVERRERGAGGRRGEDGNNYVVTELRLCAEIIRMSDWERLGTSWHSTGAVNRRGNAVLNRYGSRQRFLHTRRAGGVGDDAVRSSESFGTLEKIQRPQKV